MSSKIQRLDRLLADCSGRNYLSNINTYSYDTKLSEEKWIKLERKHHFNGQGGGKPSNIGQRG